MIVKDAKGTLREGREDFERALVVASDDMSGKLVDLQRER